MNMKVENEMALPTTKSVAVMLLEPYAGKLARTVLRGESSRKGADLLDYRIQPLIFHKSAQDFKGRVNQKVDPFVTSDSTPISPPRFCTIVCERVSPSPVPGTS